MIAAAKSLGVNAQVMNGQALQFDSEFDAVFSNAALHWMDDPKEVIGGVWRALKPGGRFVGEFGGHGNVRTIVTAMELALSARGLTVRSPWFFPRSEEYQELLESGGFSVKSIELLARLTPLPGDVGAWLETFAQPYIAVLPESDTGELISEVVEALNPELCDENGNWVADYVRLRFSAVKQRTRDE